jgi:hypothetical protein
MNEYSMLAENMIASLIESENGELVVTAAHGDATHVRIEGRDRLTFGISRSNGGGVSVSIANAVTDGSMSTATVENATDTAAVVLALQRAKRNAEAELSRRIAELTARKQAISGIIFAPEPTNAARDQAAQMLALRIAEQRAESERARALQTKHFGGGASEPKP